MSAHGYILGASSQQEGWLTPSPKGGGGSRIPLWASGGEPPSSWVLGVLQPMHNMACQPGVQCPTHWQLGGAVRVLVHLLIPGSDPQWGVPTLCKVKLL